MWRSSEDIHDKYCQEENGDFLPQRRTSSMAMSLVAAGLRTFNLFAGPWHQAGLAIQPEPANPPSASSCFPVFFNRFLGSTIRLVTRHPFAVSGDQHRHRRLSLGNPLVFNPTTQFDVWHLLDSSSSACEKDTPDDFEVESIE